MSGPDLYVFTLKSLALKKPVFFHFLGVKIFKFLYKRGYATFQCERYKKIFWPQKSEKTGLKSCS